jgi:hypothetical protein
MLYEDRPANSYQGGICEDHAICQQEVGDRPLNHNLRYRRCKGYGSYQESSPKDPMIVTLDHATHRYYRDGVLFQGPSVTQALAQCGLCDFSFVREEIRERSMSRGSSVHWLLALHDQGALDYRRVPKVFRGYRKAWMEFRKATGFVPDPLWTERSFISPLGFSGTIDRMGSLNGMRWVTLDIKTGEGDVPEWCKYQLSLYCDETKTAERIGVKLRPDGTYRVKPFPFATFYTDRAIALESINRWRRE